MLMFFAYSVGAVTILSIAIIILQAVVKILELFKDKK